MNLSNLKFRNLLSNFQNFSNLELILFVLLVIFIFTDIKIPDNITNLFPSNISSYLILFGLVTIILLYGNPLLAIIFAIFSIVLMNRIKKVDPVINSPSETKKSKVMKSVNTENKFKNSLEEEMVKKISPENINVPGPDSYHPVECDSHNAEKL